MSRSPHDLPLIPAQDSGRTFAEYLAIAFQGSNLKVVEFPHFRSRPKVKVLALAVGPSVGCHIFLLDRRPLATGPTLRAITTILRSADIPGRLPCRAWLVDENGDTNTFLVATATKAGRVPARKLDPVVLRNTMIESARSAGPLKAKRDRVAAAQDLLRLFHEPALASRVATRGAAAPCGLAADIDRLKIELQRAELDREQTLARASAWCRGARLVRGVAGSGKTCVLAWATAMLARDLQADPDCPSPRMLVVSPFDGQLRDLATRISGCLSLEAAAGPSTAVLPRWIRIGHWPNLANQLANTMRLTDAGATPPLADIERRLLQAVRASKPSLKRWTYDAIVVDEAQALSSTAIEILASLGDRHRNGDPTLHLYFDDAQSTDGIHRRPPLWKRLGIKVHGRRSILLDRCYRTPAEIMEPAFNMLVGSLIGFDKPRTAGHADLERLCRRGLIDARDDGWHSVHFAVRNGPSPEVIVAQTREAALEQAARIAHDLIAVDGVHPSDIAVITPDVAGCRKIAKIAEQLELPGLHFQELRPENISDKARRDERGEDVCLRPVNRVRGLEWPVVILVGWDGLSSSSAHRSALYVAMTRSQHMLYLITDVSSALMREVKSCTDRARMVRLETAIRCES